jgi:hypothetical protein
MTRDDERRIIRGQEVGASNPLTSSIDMTTPSGLPDCRAVCAAYPWVREAWLLGDADLLVVCDRPPRSVAPGQRKRLLAELETRTDLSLGLRLATAGQLANWLSRKGRFAAAVSTAVRLYP